MLGSFSMKEGSKMRLINSVAAGAAALGLAGSGLLFAHADASSQAAARVTTVNQGADEAKYNHSSTNFYVCDGEKDGHPVYVYFSGDTDDYYYDKSGAGGSCAKFAETGSGLSGARLGTMYLCEGVTGWDSCESTTLR